MVCRQQCGYWQLNELYIVYRFLKIMIVNHADINEVTLLIDESGTQHQYTGELR